MAFTARRRHDARRGAVLKKLSGWPCDQTTANRKTDMQTIIKSPVTSSLSSGIEPITLAESKRLIELEKIILDGEHTFIKVGVALAEIRDSRLYRCDFPTFEAYCLGKWRWTKQHCYRLIECAPIAKSNPQVTSINQARELAKVPQEKRAAVVQHAVAKASAAGRPITAQDIKTAVSPAPAPEAGLNPKRIFPAAMSGKKSAQPWWYSRGATPEKRGYFFDWILGLHKDVVVQDKKRFTERVTNWLEHEVSEGKATP